MKHLGVALCVCTLMVCDLLASEWRTPGHAAWGQWNTVGMVLAIVWFFRAALPGPHRGRLGGQRAPLRRAHSEALLRQDHENPQVGRGFRAGATMGRCSCSWSVPSRTGPPGS